MEFFTHSLTFSTRWRHPVEKCIFYTGVYILMYSHFGCCSHEIPHVIKAKLSTEYIDKFGSLQNEPVYTDGGPNYGTKSRVNSNPVEGRLVYVKTKLVNNSELGCGPLDHNKIVPKTGPWIALIKRGSCNFNEKIYFAAKNNSAAAVIVYNYEGSTNNELTMDTGGKYNVQDVVAILMTYDKGKHLVELLQNYKNVSITITVAPEKNKTPDNPGQLNNTSVLFVSISFIVLIIISLAWLVFYYIQRCRYTNAKERLSRRLANAAKKAIAKIPQRSIKLGDKELDADADQCAVCIEPYKWNDVIRILPCKHVFHKSCVDPWLLDQRSCPMCKMDILRAFGMHLNDSQESVPQDAESGLMNSTGAADDTEHLSNSEEQGGAVGGVKIVLYQHPVRYREAGGGGGGQFHQSEYSSDGSLDLQSSPIAQCHVECAGRAIVEHITNNDTCTEDEPCLARSDSIDSVHSMDYDVKSWESQSLMTGVSTGGGTMGSKSLGRSSGSISKSALSSKETI